MKLTVTFPPAVKKKLGRDSVALDFEENRVDLETVLKRLYREYGESLRDNLCDKQGKLIYRPYVNGKSLNPEIPLSDGDRISFLNIVLGG